MATAQEFFTAGTIAQLGGAILAVTAVSVTIRNVTGRNTLLIPIFVSLLLTYITAGAAGSLGSVPWGAFPASDFFASIIGWALPAINACLLFTAVLGTTELGAAGEANWRKRASEHAGKPPLGPQGGGPESVTTSPPALEERPKRSTEQAGKPPLGPQARGSESVTTSPPVSEERSTEIFVFDTTKSPQDRLREILEQMDPNLTLEAEGGKKLSKEEIAQELMSELLRAAPGQAPTRSVEPKHDELIFKSWVDRD